MNDINYLNHLEQLLHDINRLRVQRDSVNLDIFKVIRLIEMTASMIPEGEEAREASKHLVSRLLKESIGITDAVQTVLRMKTRKPFTPVEIREALAKSGFPFETYKSNPLTSINSVLKRLLADGGVSVLERDGKLRYRWKKAGGDQLIRMLKKENEEE